MKILCMALALLIGYFAVGYYDVSQKLKTASQWCEVVNHEIKK